MFNYGIICFNEIFQADAALKTSHKVGPICEQESLAMWKVLLEFMCGNNLFKQ